MTNTVDHVPRHLARFTQAAAALHNQETTSPPTMQTITQWTPSDRHGRIPCIGIDSGHLPNTRPDTHKW